MVCGQFHSVQIEMYELGRYYFRVENETRDKWSRKQTSSGKYKNTLHTNQHNKFFILHSAKQISFKHFSNAKALLQAIKIHRF